MKYYVANPNVENGVEEVDAGQTRLLPGNRLEYRSEASPQGRIIDGVLWSTKKNEVVRPAFGLLIRAEKQLTTRLDEIRATRARLVSEHQELTFLENEPLFKETKC